MDFKSGRKQMNEQKVIDLIIAWLEEKRIAAGAEGYVVGVSGGIDSAVTSALCALTGQNTLLLNMPIDQETNQFSRSNLQINFLSTRSNIESKILDLTQVYESFIGTTGDITDLSKANLQSRIRMCALYTQANSLNYLVAGTGNKVEDYGIGFFTKYGDGGVDLSPIADLKKTEVYSLARFLNIPQEIIDAKPTDGLWGDNRSDEDQIGALYEELEWAMDHYDVNGANADNLSERQKQVLQIYAIRHMSTKHKLEPPPTCFIPENLKELNNE